MKLTSVRNCIATGIVALTTLFSSTATLAVVSNDLLTNSNQTTQWEACEGSDIATGVDQFDVSHLENAGCAYRETPIVGGETYTLTCGVSSFKYSSLTLTFHDDDYNVLATESTEIYEESQGGAFSVTLTAPASATIAAVGIYGLEGSGFQDCTLLRDNPDPMPTDGSIAGTAWFDENADTNLQNAESVIPFTSVALISNGAVIAQTETDEDGGYYFGGLDLGSCYIVSFSAADQTLTFTGTGGDNDAAANGQTVPVCPTAASPNVVDVDAGFVAVPPPAPPADYAVCGTTWYSSVADGVQPISDVNAVLTNIGTGEQTETVSTDGGVFAFNSLTAGTYKITFDAVSGFTFSQSVNPLAEGGSFSGEDGMTPQFTLPADGNTDANSACTIRYANGGLIRTEVTLDPTVANDDEYQGFVGDTFTVNVLGNDEPCEGGVSEIDLLGHNVPGTVTYDAASGIFTVSDTAEAGTYSIEYGIRGNCGSYDNASINIVLEEVPPPPPPAAPPAPEACYTSVGKATSNASALHVDINFPSGQNDHATAFSPEYRFYDVDMNLVYTGLLSEAGLHGPGIFFRTAEHGLEVIGITHVAAVENGVESALTECIERTVTPIAIDLDGSGKVETIKSAASFDITGDGTPDSMAEWFGPADGILVSSNIELPVSGHHLYGNAGDLYADGFAKLAAEDANDDGKISGSELHKLAIWVDANSNAVIDEGEMSTLQSHSIESLPTDHYKFAARATLQGGGSLIMQDRWLSIRPVVQATK